MARKQMLMEANGVTDMESSIDKAVYILAVIFREVDIEKIYSMPYLWFKSLLKETKDYIKKTKGLGV